MSRFSYVNGDVIATRLPDAPTVFVSLARAHGGTIEITPDELDQFCAAWLVHRLDSAQYEAMRRLLSAWGEVPQSVQFKRYGEP